MSSRNTPRHRAAARRRPPRAVAGAAVATVAVVLLMGGQGTLAFWRSGSTVAGGTVKSGAVTLTGSCTPWTFTQTGGPSGYVGSAYPGATPAGSASTAYVEPNDTLTSTCTYTLGATGKHLRGSLQLVQPSGAPAGATATATYTVGGAPQSTFTTADNGKPVQVVVTLVLPSSSAVVQGSSFTLSGASVAATQVHS